MRPPGSFKIRKTRHQAPTADPLVFANGRCQKIVDSLCLEILEGKNLRIRRVFEEPRAIYRVELHKPELNYQRTTLLDEDALEELLEIDAVRDRVEEALR